MGDCVFCDILQGRAPASIVHEDAHCLAFMALRPIREGAFLVIPKDHIDHFTDLPDTLAAHILTVAQRYGRKLLTLPGVVRTGYVVHGFGVPHAHLNVVPQHDTYDIISARFIDTAAPYRITESLIEPPSRAALDAMAAHLHSLPD
ncbi:HIT family protein [Gymnodinialimonas sp.]